VGSRHAATLPVTRLGSDIQIRHIPLFVNEALFDGGFDGATGFVGVRTGAEFAVLGKGSELFEVKWQLVETKLPEGELADAGCIDHGAAAAQRNHNGGRGGVPTLIVFPGYLAHGLGDITDEVNDR